MRKQGPDGERSSREHFCGRGWVGAIALALLCAGPLWAREVRKPKVRAITAFVRIEREHYAPQIEDALRMLGPAKAAFEKAGYEVETVRITTQPFPEYIQSLSELQALQFFRELDDFAKKESVRVNIGPAVSDDRPTVAQVELLGKILVSTELNASITVAGEDGIHWNAVRAAARTMKYLEEHSSNGVRNFDFAAVAMLEPYAPFFPGSHHEGKGGEFSIGLEAGNFVADVFEDGHGDPGTAAENLTRALTEEAQVLDSIARQVEKDSGWTYAGLDATPAPSLDSSIGAAIEKLSGAKFGSSGTLTAARIITEAVRSVPVKRVGYSGLMLPVLEDPVLAERWTGGTYSIDALLAYSAVCGTGLDTIPLPGDVSQQQLERIIGDVASLAVKWHKPLTARLIPAPGKKAGERTQFDSPHLTNAALQQLP